MTHELRSFDQVLALFDNGLFPDNVMQDLHRALEALNLHVDSYQTSASAELTLKITIKQDRQGTLEMKADKNVKLPKDPVAKAIAWATDENTITPANPNQMRMELRNVSRDAPVKSA